MKAKVTHDYLLIRESVNPFLKKTSDSGLFIPQGLAQTQETGDVEQLDKIIGFAIVAAVGAECRWIKEGDGVFYDRRSARPVPMKETLWQFNERNIVSYVEREELHAQFEQYAEDERKLAELQSERYDNRIQEEALRKAKEKAEREAKILSGEYVSKPLSPLIRIK